MGSVCHILMQAAFRQGHAEGSPVIEPKGVRTGRVSCEVTSWAYLQAVSI